MRNRLVGVLPPLPPPEVLPPPGDVQPVDPSEATAAVRAAYVDGFDGRRSLDDKLAVTEHGDELRAAWRQVEANFPTAVATARVELGEVVFVSATEAAVGFELRYEEGAEFGPQVGRAVLVDGRWLVAEPTACMVLGWGGGTCP